MKKLTSIVAVVSLVAVCCALFVGCAGSPDKVDNYVEKLNTADNMYFIMQDSNGASTEVIVSVDKISVFKLVPGPDGKPVKEENCYVVDGNKVRRYFKFPCSVHKDKKGNPTMEWKYEDIEVVGDYLAMTRDALRAKAAVFALKGENLVYNKDAKGFVYADGKAPAIAFKNVVVNAKSGELSIKFDNTGHNVKYSFMNFGSARVSLPSLCKDFADSVDNK